MSQDKKKRHTWKDLAVVLALAAALPGCATILDGIRKNRSIEGQASRAAEIARFDTPRRALVTESGSIYVDSTPVRVSDNKRSLDMAYPKDISIVSNVPLGLPDIAEQITLSTRIPVVFLDMAASAPPPGSTQIAGAGMPPPAGFGAGGPLAGLPGLPGGAAAIPASLDPGIPGFPSSKKMEVRYTGKLSGLLDEVTARQNLFWRYDSEAQRIVLLRQDTQTFAVLAFPGGVKTSSSIDNQSISSSGGGRATSSGGASTKSNSGQSVAMSAELEMWKDISDAVGKMLTPSGKAYANPSSGTVTVTDSPVAIANVRQYITQQNVLLGSQVTLNVKIYSVELDTDNKLGFDWNLIYRKALDFGISYAVPSSVVAQGVQAAILNPSSNWNTTTVMVKALETLGKTSLVTNESAVTMNNMPVPVKVANETTYLASTSGGIVGGGGLIGGSNALTTTLEPGKVITGLTMTLLPKIIDARQLMLQMALDISTLKGIDTITSGNQSIQAPRVAIQSSTQRVAMENGQTLVLTGLNMDEDKVGYEGALLPSALTNGGKRVVTVIMVTPQITQGIRQ